MHTLYPALFLLVACVPSQHDHPTPKFIPPGSLATTASLPNEGGDWPRDDWWTPLGDPQLASLIDEALAGSPDIVAAQARLQQAEGMARAAGATLAPQGAVLGEAGATKQSYNNGFPKTFVPKGWNDTGRVGAEFSWDLDFFGRNRAVLRAAISEQKAAYVEAQAVRLGIAAAVASAYGDLIRLDSARQAAAAALRVRTETASLVHRRVDAGLDPLSDQKQAESAMNASAAILKSAEEQVLLTRHRIAALMGSGPDRGLSIVIPAAAPAAPLALPDTLPLDLLGRRPDIVAARYRAEAASARVGAARAAFYPNVNLTAFVGFQSLGLNNLLDQGSHAGNAGAAIHLPIFNRGGLRGRYGQATGEYDEAVAQYNLILIRAVREVADAVASRNALAGQLADLRAAVAGSEQAYRIARQRYEGQLSSFLSVLTAEDRLIANQRSLAQTEAEALLLDVDLIRAMGGGFFIAPAEG